MSPRAIAAAIAALGFAAAAVAVTAAETSDQPVRSLGVLVFFGVIGLAWIEAGAVAHARRPANRTGLLMAGVGLAWLASSTTSTDWSPTFTFGLVIANLWIALFVHLVLAFPAGRLDRASRLVAGATYLLALAATLAALPFAEPGELADCEDVCPENLLQATDRPAVVDAVDTITAVCFAVIAVAVVWLLVRRWRASSAVARRALTPVLGAGAATLVMLLVAIAASAASDTVSEGLFLVALATFGTIPFAFLVGLVRARLARGSVGGLVVELGEDPLDGDVRGALARSLRDPSLELAFWLPDEETYVDAAGRPYLPPADASRATTVVSHGGERVALLIHDPALGDDPDLVEAACAAAGLALSNERLQAELRRHVDELRASRARIVGAGDAARRRIERDLHDGAQQRLVSLAIMLRRAEDAGDPAAARALLARARTELDDAIRELRELARGIHPAVLTDRGLEAALTALVDRSGVHATLTIDLPERPPREVEIAAYYVVAEALSNAAKHVSEARVEVEVTRDPAGVRVRVADDGPGGAHVEPQGGLRGLADRVEAIGGRLRVGPSDAGGTAVVAVVPLRGRT